jgi:succinyl-CoA synthetase beta subunit
MNIHEYQGKQIFARYGIPVPKGIPAFSVSEVKSAAAQLIAETGSEVVVVKAQIHAGGRGKAGGVKVVKGSQAAEDAGKALLGATLVTPQTGPKGKRVERLYVEQGLDIAREIYMAMLVDREQRRICFMASTEGGVEIEKVAAETPEKILKAWVDPATGMMPYQARRIGFQLGLSGPALNEFVGFAQKMYAMFLAEDCSLVEINPVVVRKSGGVIALDAKVNFDENASFRHKEWEDLRDKSEENPAETKAKETGISYVALDSNIGCLVNGAGLAMSTMDIIKHFGGEPANFLDVGGGANEEQVTKAFQLIMKDPEVKGIFVNIFGGIMKCDIIAAGVIAATKAVNLKVPLVVRLEGTNVDLGKKMLADSGLAITPAANMKEGAAKIVELVKKGGA